MIIEVDINNCNNGDKNSPTLEDLKKLFDDMAMVDFISLTFETKLSKIV